MPTDTPRDIVERITEYLSLGGFWNPESMNHDKVRDLLIDCRAELTRLRSAAGAERIYTVDDMTLAVSVALKDAVPPGFVRVPVEPTEEMLKAGAICFGAHGSPERNAARRTWSAMLTASPAADGAGER